MVNSHIDIIQDQINEILALLKQYNSNKESWEKTVLPYLVPFVVIGITILGQLYVFKLNKQKEIKLAVAGLFGKFNSKCLFHIHTLLQYYREDINFLRCEALLNKYDEKVKSLVDSNFEGLSDLDTIVFQERLKRMLEKKGEHNVKAREFLEKIDLEKTELLEILSQMHFYYNDDTLEGYINEFKPIIMFKLEDVMKCEDLERDDFFKIYFEKIVTEIIVKQKEIYKNISDTLLKLP